MKGPSLRATSILLCLAAIIISRCHALLPSSPPLHHTTHITSTYRPSCHQTLASPLQSTTSIVEKDDIVSTTTLPLSNNNSNKNTNINNELQQLELAKHFLGGAFTQKLVELEHYKHETGHCLVPKRYESNPTLGNWVNKQRQNYKKFVRGEKSSMNQVRTRTYFLHVNTTTCLLYCIKECNAPIKPWIWSHKLCSIMLYANALCTFFGNNIIGYTDAIT